jgi:futalosine hydrolase
VSKPTIVVASELEWQALTPVHGLDYVLTGVGMPAVYRTFLTRDVTGPLISLGIAGAYEGTGLNIGDVVIVASEIVGDLGMELPLVPRFTPLRDFPFGTSHKSVQLYAPPTAGVSVVHGCTVSTVTGTQETGIRHRDTYGVAIETMEGYAVADIAAANRVPCLEVRAISNFASVRDMRPENIRAALGALSTFWSVNGGRLLEELNEA